jgi:hypothetical protein
MRNMTGNAITNSIIAKNAVSSAKLSQDAVHLVWDDNSPDSEVLYRTNAGDVFARSATNLSNNAGISDEPAIAVSGNNVYIVWRDSTPGRGEIFYTRSTDGGATFSGIVNLSNTPGSSVSPSIAISGNNVYVAWDDNTGTGEDSEIYYRRSTDGGATFSGIVNLSNTPGDSKSPAIALSGNRVYIVWFDSDDTDNGEEILYRRSTDGGATFGSTFNLSNNAGGSLSPAISASGNRVYVVWSDNTPGNSVVFYRRSTDGGATFGSTRNLSNPADGSGSPAIAVSGNNVYVAWPENTGILYRKSIDGGATFGSPANLSNTNGGSSDPALAVSGNNVYVVWRDNILGNPDILLRKSVNAGATFGSTINVSQNSGFSELPAIAVSPNNF